MAPMSHVLSSIEKLERQRQAAALARSNAHMLQLKVIVLSGCTIAGVIGFALYRSGAANSASPPPAEQSGVYQGPASQRIGAIQVPHQGDTCLNYRFDNKTGTMGDEKEVSCTPISIVPSLSETSRTEALMKAFKFNK
jgi:hypothetical protein